MISRSLRYEWSQQFGAFLLPGEAGSLVLKSRTWRLSPYLHSKDVAEFEFWLDSFQWQLQRLMDGFLNGVALSNVDRVLMRPMSKSRGQIKTSLRRAWHFASEKLQLIDKHECYHFEQMTVSKQIIALYGLFQDALTSRSEPPTTQVRLAVGEIDCQAEHALQEIARQASRRILPGDASLLVHGSIGSGERVGYSDLDLWLLVSKSSICDVGKLDNICRFSFATLRRLFDFDPLQHHGLMVATEVDLLRYSETFLPLAAIRKSKVVFPAYGFDHSASIRDSSLDAAISFFNVVAMMRAGVNSGQLYRSAFDVKHIFSIIMLLPALYLGARNIPCFKGDSFGIVRAEVPPEIWSIMDEISCVREGWVYKASRIRSVVFAAIRNPFLFQFLLRRGLSGRYASLVGGGFPSNWENRSLELAEFLWERLCVSTTT